MTHRFSLTLFATVLVLFISTVGCSQHKEHSTVATAHLKSVDEQKLVHGVDSAPSKLVTEPPAATESRSIRVLDYIARSDRAPHRSSSAPRQTITETPVIASAHPRTVAEYRAVHGVTPTPGQLEAVKDAASSVDARAERLNSKADFMKLVASGPTILIVIGHNEKGLFRFPHKDPNSSEAKMSISAMEEHIRKAGKRAVFLTCNGARYTNFPAPFLRTTYTDAFTLAGYLATELPKLYNLSPGTELNSPKSESASDAIGGGLPNLSGRTSQAKRCIRLFSSSSSAAQATAISRQKGFISTGGAQRIRLATANASFHRVARGIIRKAEFKGVVSGTTFRVAAGLTAAGTAVVVYDRLYGEE